MKYITLTRNGKTYNALRLDVADVANKGMFASPWTGFLEFSPPIAQAFLDLNHNNRTVSPKTVEKYVETMQRDQWMPEIGTPIAVSEKGELQNGQHRLLALIAANKTVLMNASFGVSEDALLFFDGGRTRTVADNAGLMGVSHSQFVSACANVLSNVVGGVTGRSLQAPDVVQFSDENSDAFGWLFSAGFPELKKSYVNGPLVLAYRTNPEKVAEWTQGFRTGENLPTGSPIAAARQMLFVSKSSRTGVDRVDMATKILGTIHKYIKGETVTKIYTSDKTVPYFVKAHKEGTLIRTWWEESEKKKKAPIEVVNK